MNRVDKINYYLDMAEVALERSTCLRRKWGAVIVKNDEIIATGYNGAPRGRKNCIDLNYCMREKMHIPRGERYEMCRSVHAEANAIISAARKDCLDATLYMVGIIIIPAIIASVKIITFLLLMFISISIIIFNKFFFKF